MRQGYSGEQRLFKWIPLSVDLLQPDRLSSQKAQPVVGASAREFVRTGDALAEAKIGAATQAANPVIAIDMNTVAHALLGQTNQHLAATAVCNELARQFNAHRVSIGWFSKHSDASRCTVLAQSSVDIVKLSADAQARLSDAMYEALDQADTALYDVGSVATSLPSALTTISTAQAQLATLKTPIVFSTILAIEQRLVGAITIEIASSQAPQFRLRWSNTIQALPQLTQMLACGLQLHSDAQSNLRKRFNTLKFKSGSRFAMAGAALIALAALLIPVSNPVSATARLEGLAQRSVGAPSAGILKTVLVRPGDSVTAGQVIAQLSERDFELEKTRLQSEQLQAESGYSSAMAKGDRTAMMVAQAKGEEIVSQLGLINHQLEQIQLRAPIDGVLIQGDLQPLTGTPVEKGQSLFVIAPKQKFRVVAEIEERDLGRIQTGQKGRLTLSSLPWQQWDVVVQRIAPAATAVEARAVIEVQTELITPQSGLADGLKPGLRGVIQLQANDATVAAIAWDRIRVRWQLFAWRWLPWLAP